MNIDVEYASSASWDSDMLARMHWLRENDPVHWSEKEQLWVLSKYADVTLVSKNQQLFTSGQGVRPGHDGKIGLIDEPEPRHMQLRRLINKGFTPRMVAKLEEKFASIVDETLDAVAGAGECDFVNSVAVPLPLLVIAEMLGIRREDRDRFHHWSDCMIAADGNQSDPDIMVAAGVAFVEYSEYLQEIIAERRAHPQDDLVSILATADDEGVLGKFDFAAVPGAEGAVNEEHLALVNNELIMMLVILLVAGNETTRNAISGGMQLLIEHPSEREKLLRDPSLIPSAVEEMLRMVSPVHSFSRTATEDTEIRGTPIRAGQQVLMLYPSANRDADMYDAPDVFRVERNPEHLAFGVGGHFCLGASLARMEMRVAFTKLLERFPDMRYADDGEGPVLIPSALVRSCVRMNVRYSPETAQPDASLRTG